MSMSVKERRQLAMSKHTTQESDKALYTYSVVAPVFNEDETLPHFYERIVVVMEEMGEPFELLLVNDGSHDDSYRIMQELHARDPRVHVINFSRNFGHQIAISAGLDYARGKAVIILDADLQDPPEVIPTLVERWKDGAENAKVRHISNSGLPPLFIN